MGDPKQSIYRFRRADVEQMRRMQERMEQAGGRTVKLAQNFRSQRPVTDWVNHVFARWMSDGGEGERYVQADYEEMSPRWQAVTDSAVGPRVWALGNEAVDGRVNDVRQQEASEIAELLNRIVDQGWLVLDRDATDEAGSGDLSRCHLLRHLHPHAGAHGPAGAGDGRWRPRTFRTAWRARPLCLRRRRFGTC